MYREKYRDFSSMNARNMALTIKQLLKRMMDFLPIQTSMVYMGLGFLFTIVALDLELASFDKVIVNSIFLSAFLFFSGVAYFEIKSKKEMKASYLTYKVEEAIKLNLDFLQKKGFTIYHDIVLQNIKVDYLIISTQGVFSINIKNYEKSFKDGYKIVHNSDTLSFYDEKNKKMKPMKEVVETIKHTQMLSNSLQQITQKAVNILPIVICSNGYMESNLLLKNIWILNVRNFSKFILKHPHELFLEDVTAIANSVEIYMKNIQQNSFQEKPIHDAYVVHELYDA